MAVCPRCRRRLHPSSDPEASGWCEWHGDIYTPVVTQEEIAEEVEPRPDRQRQRGAKTPTSRTRTRSRHYADGCEVAAECLACPLERCKHETFHEVEQLVALRKLQGEPANPVHWVAWRVARGEAVGVETVRRHFGMGEREAQAVMGGGWARLLPEYAEVRGG